MAWWWAARSCASIEQNAASPDLRDQARGSGPRARQWFTIEEPMSMERLAECRQQIDVVDSKSWRCSTSGRESSKRSAASSSSLSLPIYEPKREDQVFRNVTSNNQGPLTRGSREAHLRAHHRRDADHPARQDAVVRDRSLDPQFNIANGPAFLSRARQQAVLCLFSRPLLSVQAAPRLQNKAPASPFGRTIA